VSAHCRFLLPVSERNVAFDEFEMSEVRLRRPIGVMLLLGIRGEKVGLSSGKLSPALFHSRGLRSACQTLALVIFRRLVPRQTRNMGSGASTCRRVQNSTSGWFTFLGFLSNDVGTAEEIAESCRTTGSIGTHPPNLHRITRLVSVKRHI
jgi:hypothetical protein